MILTFILENQLENAKTAKSILLLKWDMDIGKILLSLSCVKHKQLDFSLLVNGIYWKKIISLNIIRIISEIFVSILSPKWRGCFYLQFV